MGDLSVIIPAITTGLVEVVKPFLPDKKYTPVITILIAVLLTAAMVGVGNEDIILGFMYGLASCGLYDLTGMSK